MKQVNRQKLLGQYFSGKRIADALFDLLGKPKNQTVIDPMCGQGDLLIPFCKHNSIYGIELDPIAYHKATTDKETYEKYINLKKLYMSQLTSIYNLFKKSFISKYKQIENKN